MNEVCIRLCEVCILWWWCIYLDFAAHSTFNVEFKEYMRGVRARARAIYWSPTCVICDANLIIFFIALLIS